MEELQRMRNAHATLRAEAEQQQRQVLQQLHDSEQAVAAMRDAASDAAAAALQQQQQQQQQQQHWAAKVEAVQAQAQAELNAAREQYQRHVTRDFAHACCCSCVLLRFVTGSCRASQATLMALQQREADMQVDAVTCDV